MTIQPKYRELLLDDDVRRWFENLRAKSVLTATVEDLVKRLEPG